MSSPSNPASPRRRAASVGGTLGLIVGGIVFDVGSLPNVPGAAEFVPGVTPEVTSTDLGTTLALVVMAAWLTVIWRRRLPELTVAAGGVLAVIGVTYILLLVGSMALVRRRPRRMPLVAGLTSAGVLLFAAREAFTDWGAAMPWYIANRPDAQSEPAWIVVPFVVAVLALGVTASIVFSTQARARAARSDERAAAEHRRADLLSEQMVRQAERERIARDMHDALAHRLSVVSLHAGALEAAASAGSAAGVDGGAGEIARTVREQTHAALQDMRGLIGDLRGSPAASVDVPASMRAIGAMVADLRAGGASVSPYVVIESPERAGAMLDSAVFRIVQEALTNAIKHAPGTTIDLLVYVEPQGGARIRVVNPLPAFAPATVPGGGNGTLGIRERAAALQGTAWIGAHDGMFIVDVSLPWQERG